MRPFFFVPLVARMGRPPLGPLVARTAVRVGPPCLPDIPFQPNGFRTDAT